MNFYFFQCLYHFLYILFLFTVSFLVIFLIIKLHVNSLYMFLCHGTMVPSKSKFTCISLVISHLVTGQEVAWEQLFLNCVSGDPSESPGPSSESRGGLHKPDCWTPSPDSLIWFVWGDAWRCSFLASSYVYCWWYVCCWTTLWKPLTSLEQEEAKPSPCCSHTLWWMSESVKAELMLHMCVLVGGQRWRAANSFSINNHNWNID